MAALATAEDLATYLQSDVDTAAAMQLLDLVSGKVRSACGQDFELVEDDEIVLPGLRAVLTLPQRPVLAVPLVRTQEFGGPMLNRELNVDYSRAGPELAWTSTTARLATHVRLPYLGWWPDYVEVVYTHGYATIPGDVIECVLVRAAELMSNPVFLAHERVDDYSYQTSRAHRGDELLDALVDRYRGRASMATLL